MSSFTQRLIPVGSSPDSPLVSSPFESRLHHHHKDAQFISKHGQRHHKYDNDKAPYPLSYDRHVLEMESLDNSLTMYLRGSISYVNFKTPPARTLDLGCGTGTWVIEAAKEWKNSHFVGFDLVNIQISLALLPPSVARRIEWRHGNFLTTKLPFEDEEFDHVHIQSIAKGVPENKWDVLFGEVNRVLRIDGSVEVIEDDVLFPTLPKWFTDALRSRPRRVSCLQRRVPDTLQSDLHLWPLDTPLSPVHDHALLESLNKSVFEHRFVNMTPTALLPNYFNMYFGHVTLSPVISFPMLKIPPLLPLPPQMTTSYTLEKPKLQVPPSPATSNSNRSPSLSVSSTVVVSPSSTFRSSILSRRSRTASLSPTSVPESPESLLTCPLFTQPRTPDSAERPGSFNCFMLDGSLNERKVTSPAKSLFPIEKLQMLTERSLAMQLYRTYHSVLACQEAMWEELQDRIRNGRSELQKFGWDTDDELEELQSRNKFELLIERYRKDMDLRASLWCTLTGFGWPLPSREPLSKAERIEEERIRKNMLATCRFINVEDSQTPCRSLRVLVGYKI